MEGYYTTDEQTEKQYLNVVWTQDNIMGPQSGGGVGEEYIHRHMLRGFLCLIDLTAASLHARTGYTAPLYHAVWETLLLFHL